MTSPVANRPQEVRRTDPATESELQAAIAARAFARWVARGSPEGGALQDWLEAEAELRTGAPGAESAPRTDLAHRLAPTESFLRAVLASTFDPVISIDSQGTILLASESVERLFGWKTQEVIGQNIRVLMPESYRAAHESGLAAHRATGETNVVFRTREFPILRKDGATVPCEISVSRADSGQDGQLIFTGIIRDLSAHKQAEKREAAEHAVTRILAESRGLADAAPRLLQAICESFQWDVGALWIVDGAGQALRNVDVWHAPAVSIAEFERVCRERTFSRGVGLPGRIWASGECVWIPDVTQDDNFPRAEIAAREQLRGACGFPLHNGRDVLGAMEFFSRRLQPLDQQLLDTMASIGMQISQFVERRQVEQAWHERQHEFALAREIQQALFPAKLPDVPGLAIAGASLPTQETGGDYWDVFALPDERFAIAIGDASGHGIPAALMVTETRACLRAYAATHTDLGRMLALTNQRLYQDLPTGQFVTLLLLAIDPHTRSLTFSNAGHCPGCILSRYGTLRATLQSIGLPLGVEPKGRFPAAPATSLQAGDLIFLYTDGVVDNVSATGERFRLPHALDVIRAHRHEPPQAILQALLGALRETATGQTQLDDCTAVVIKVEDVL